MVKEIVTTIVALVFVVGFVASVHKFEQNRVQRKQDKKETE